MKIRTRIVALGACALAGLGIGMVAPSVYSTADSSDGPLSNGARGSGYHKTTMAGSSGTVDEKDFDEVIFFGGRAKLPNSVDSGIVKLRYHLDFETDGSGFTSTIHYIGLRYKDNGASARVIAKLKCYDWYTGDVTTLVSFNSDDFPESDDYQTQWVNDTTSVTIESYNTYYMEVSLKKSDSDARAEVGIINAWVLES